MKRYIRTAPVIFFAALALAGCSKAEGVQGNPDSALRIESVGGISSFALMQEPATKAVITGNTLPDSEVAVGVGIFVTEPDGGAYDGHAKGYANVNFTNSGSGWSTATPVYLSDTEGKLYGYFPYNQNANDLRAIPVESSLNGTDYLYADTQSVNHSNKSVSLHMNHALSRLHLTIKKGANFTANAPLSKITLKSTAIDATGTIDLTTGAVTASKKSGETGTVELATDGTITADGIEKDILLVPADGSEGKKGIVISLLIDGKPAGITIPAENGLDIRSGIQNNVTLTIEDTGIKVTGIGVNVWDEQGSQQIKVGAHTVTVKLSDDAGIADNLIVQCKSDGDLVIIESYSKNDVKPLIVRVNNSSLIVPTENGSVNTFTISNITSDITATLAYAKTRTVTFNRLVDIAPNVEGYVCGKAEPITVIEGRPSTLTVTPEAGYDLDYFEINGIKYGNQESLLIPDDVTAIDSYFHFIDMLDGVFSVGENKKVRFSRGNLWCDGTGTGWSDDIPKIKSWGFESNQYINTRWRSIAHISHFFWCADATNSVRIAHIENWDSNLFTNKDETTPSTNFAVDGQQGFWRDLSKNEMGYLLSRKDRNSNNLYKHGVNVCGYDNCLILLPDDWKWGENGVGADWQEGGYPETSTDKVTWRTMEAFGAVCLPPSGCRMSYIAVTSTNEGYYWLSTAGIGKNAFYFDFSKGIVDFERNLAHAVRLVTDVK